MFNTMTDYNRPGQYTKLWDLASRLQALPCFSMLERNSMNSGPLLRALYPSSGGVMDALHSNIYPPAGLLIGALQQQRQQHISQMLSVLLEGQIRLFEPLGSDNWLLDEENEDETEEKTASLTPANLEACRATVKAELDELEKQCKALLGQQKALSTRFSEVAGKFQLLKIMENEVTTNNVMNAKSHDETD